MEERHNIVAALAALAANCAASRHRHLVVLAGERDWCAELAEQAHHALPGEWCWIGDTSPAEVHRVAPERTSTLLGGEWQGVVYDAYAGFDPDAFGVVAGSVRAGGLLLLLTPPLTSWHRYPDPQRSRLAVYPYGDAQVGGRFLQRLAALLQQAEEAYVIEQGSALPPPPQLAVAAPVPSSDQECATNDQQVAVEALCRVVSGHRRRPLVLVSDRGRGKSSALGLAAARLLQQGVKRIVVTAPRLAAVEPVFRHAAVQLPQGTLERGLLSLPGGGELCFEPPDHVVHQPPACELLLVDEAAAIPVSLLTPMLRHHSRIAFATTVHGYEGTGRGFELRFRKVLDEVTPSWHRLRMAQPIRWAEDDPLERLVFSALLLDAEPDDDVLVAQVPLQQCRVERVERDTLLQDEELLSRLFGLLVLAHYRTSPGDLRNLLDGPNLDIYLLRYRQHLLGCALVGREGTIDAELATHIYAGERRLRGNLMPQSLAFHAGMPQALQLAGARVMRIAVHPARQGEGLGQRLIDAVAAAVFESGGDYLGASFGADARLLDFWQRCDCLPVHMGVRREASSGSSAVMVMRPLSPQGGELFRELRAQMASQLPVLLSEPLAALEGELVMRLLAGLKLPSPGERAWADCCSFATTQRDYANCLHGMSECLLYALSQQPVLPADALQLAIAKVLQRQPWEQLQQNHPVSGRKEVLTRLRGLYSMICEVYRQAV